MFIRYEQSHDPFRFMNVSTVHSVRITPQYEDDLDDDATEDTVDPKKKTGRYLLLVQFLPMVEAAVVLAIFENMAEASIVGETIQSSMAHGCQVYDVRIAQAYIQEARRLGLASKIELKYVIAAATKMTWQEYQARATMDLSPLPTDG